MYGLTLATVAAFGAGFGLRHAIEYRKLHPMKLPHFDWQTFAIQWLVMFAALSLAVTALHYAVEWLK